MQYTGLDSFFPLTISFFFLSFFMRTIFKVFIEFVTILFLFYVVGFFFGQEAGEILVPQPQIEPIPPALEAEVLTTRPPGKFLV